jgi:DNA polymerase-1
MLKKTFLNVNFNYIFAVMKTLIIDGQWNLRRNFHSQKNLKSSTGHLCGGIMGFIMSMKAVMNKVLPDRVVVAWDGFNAGKLRYNIYAPYKANRNKNWESEERMIANEGMTMDEKEREKFEIFKQKILLKNILDELFVRQMEVDYIEADDLIAQYVLKSEEDDEQIYIYSRDRDFLQLISDKVFVISPDNLWALDRKTYEEKYGYTVDNELLFKCFDGDDGDGIGGVFGITRETLIKYFPNMKKEKYLYKQLIEECYEAKKDKKIGKRKIYDKIIEAQDVLYRNAQLINLRKPFLNAEAKKLVDIVKHGTLDDTREIISAISLFTQEGLIVYVGQEFADNYFSPFYMLMSKEKEYTKKMKL